MNKKEKLTTRDLITLAVFSVIYALIAAITALVGMIPVVYPFTAGIGMIPCGIVWIYLRTKVPKRGAIIIQTAVLALLLLLLGSFWPSIVGTIVAGVIAEIITQSGEHTSFARITIGYIAFGLCLTVCANLPPLIVRDYYFSYSIANGTDPEMLNGIISFLTGSIFMASLGVSAMCCLLGAFLGKKMLKKHFEKAGISKRGAHYG